jgi:hypothetical protein
MRRSSNVRSIASYQRKLDLTAIRGLRSVLAPFGYNIVPAHRAIVKESRGRYRKIPCPRCSRRFALPMNLGRHFSVAHTRNKKAA